MMHNPFLVIRFVFFALHVNFSLLILVFASWNIHAALAAGSSTPGTPVFLILTSCALFLVVTLGLTEFVVTRVKSSRIMFECIWSAVLGLLQIGAAISVTVNGPAEICQVTSDWSACASSALLTPTSLLSSFTLIAYFFTLFVTTTVHARKCPGIWSRTVYSVDWFQQPTLPQVYAKQDINDIWAPYLEDIESSAARKHQQTFIEEDKAPWAQTANIRRGVDHPFTKRDDMTSARSSPTVINATLPPLPLKVQSKGPAGRGEGSRFIETFRESQVTARSGTLSINGLQLTSRVAPFPPRVDDHDLPIPLPRLSEWIRADAIKGINVHTVPYSP